MSDQHEHVMARLDSVHATIQTQVKILEAQRDRLRDRPKAVAKLSMALSSLRQACDHVTEAKAPKK